ncbi:MAG: DUF5681 domain-containing protein [Planctomycetota bacterium]|nr:DUF5681 domain-containing protein [Planctomycetota bacterium]
MSQFEPGHSIGKSTRFQPGQSGNPGGQPKGLATVARKVLAEAASEGDMTKGEALMRKLYELALDGNVHAIKLLLDREWPAPRSGELSRDDTPVVVLRDFTGLRLNDPKERVIESTPPSEPSAIPEQAPIAEPPTWSARRPDDDDRPSGAVL